MTFPVIDILKEDFPSAGIYIVVGPKAKLLFDDNPDINSIYVFNKHQSWLKSASWIFELSRERFGLVVDLRNTAIPAFIFPGYTTSFFKIKDRDIHMKDKHLRNLRTVYSYEKEAKGRHCLFIPDREKQYVEQLIVNEIGRGERYVIVGPGAADRVKRWPERGFVEVCDKLIEFYRVKIVFVGDGKEDKAVVRRILKMMRNNAVDLSGRMSLIQLAELFKYCILAIVNDSAPMHLASYLDVPVFGLFRQANVVQYKPWSRHCHFISGKNGMDGITVEDVFNSFRINGKEVIFKDE